MDQFSARSFRPEAGAFPAEDLECLRQFRRTIEENEMLLARSRAAIDWSREAMALLDRLHGPSGAPAAEASPAEPAGLRR